MTHRSDIDRVLETWMTDGPNAISDRVVDVVAARIGVQRQRRAWPFQGRTIVTPLKLAAALAAVAIIAVVGYNLLPRQPGFGGQTTPLPTASPAATATPTSSPVATGPIALHEGVLAGGRYRLEPIDDQLSLSVVADVPAGWQGIGNDALISPRETENTGILISFMVTDGPFSDPCQWDRDSDGTIDQGDVEVGPTVDDLVAALRANTSYTSSTPNPVTFGQFEGQELELQLPGNDVIRACDRRPGERAGDYFVFPEGFYALGPNSRWHLYIVDVDGTRLITLVSIAEGTPQADIAAAEAIVESFEYTP